MNVSKKNVKQNEAFLSASKAAFTKRFGEQVVSFSKPNEEVLKVGGIIVNLNTGKDYTISRLTSAYVVITDSNDDTQFYTYARAEKELSIPIFG